jgi:hypothetical protein
MSVSCPKSREAINTQEVVKCHKKLYSPLVSSMQHNVYYETKGERFSTVFKGEHHGFHDNIRNVSTLRSADSAF